MTKNEDKRNTQSERSGGPRDEWSTRFVDNLRAQGKTLRVIVDDQVWAENPDAVEVKPGMVTVVVEGDVQTLNLGPGQLVTVKTVTGDVVAEMAKEFIDTGVTPGRPLRDLLP